MFVEETEDKHFKVTAYIDKNRSKLTTSVNKHWTLYDNDILYGENSFIAGSFARSFLVSEKCLWIKKKSKYEYKMCDHSSILMNVAHFFFKLRQG